MFRGFCAQEWMASQHGAEHNGGVTDPCGEAGVVLSCSHETLVCCAILEISRCFFKRAMRSRLES